MKKSCKIDSFSGNMDKNTKYSTGIDEKIV